MLSVIHMLHRFQLKVTGVLRTELKFLLRSFDPRNGYENFSCSSVRCLCSECSYIFRCKAFKLGLIQSFSLPYVGLGDKTIETGDRNCNMKPVTYTANHWFMWFGLENMRILF